MTRSTALALAAALVALPALAAPKINEPAPDFSLTDTNGKAHKLSDFRGKTVVLEWLNHGCPFVKKHYDSGNMPALQKDATGKGVIWLSIVSSAPGKQGHFSNEKQNEIAKEKGAAPTAILIDEPGSVGRLYDARTTPHMFVVDPQGVLRYMGAIDSIPSSNKDDVAKAEPLVREAYDAVLAGKAPKTQVTKSYGCSVKYAGNS